MTAAKRLLSYLKGALDLAITYRKGNFGLTGYTDASFAANPDSRKSTTGYLFMFCGAPVERVGGYDRDICQNYWISAPDMDCIIKHTTTASACDCGALKEKLN